MLDTTANGNALRLRWSIVVGTIALVTALALAWRFTPLAQVATPENVGDWARQFGSLPWAPIVVVLAYTPACLVMFPRPLITLAAVVAFGPWSGFAYAISGILLATAIMYAAGRLMNAATVRRLAGRRLVGLTGIVRRRGLIAMAAIRFLPVAPFAVESLLAGAIRMKLWHVIFGTFLGMLPGTLTATIFGQQIEAGLRDPARINYWIIAAVLVALAGGIFIGRRWFAKLQRDQSTLRTR